MGAGLVSNVAEMIGPVLTTFVIAAGFLICGGLHLKIQGKPVRQHKGSLAFLTAACGLCSGCGTLFYNLAIARADVALVSAISFSAPVVAALYGRLVHQERLSRQQVAALGFIVAGVTVLALSYGR